MTKQDNQPPPIDINKDFAAREVLNAVVQELDILHRQVKQQLTEDIQKLQTDKSRLSEDVERLQRQHEKLQQERFHALSERQIAQQQVWLKQLAQVLASNLQHELIKRINQLRDTNNPAVMSNDSGGLLPSNDIEGELSSRELEAVLDTSLNETFQSLQHELSNYQSNLSQRLHQVQTIEQQVDGLLETVVVRLKDQLQSSTSTNPEIANHPNPNPVETSPPEVVQPQPTVSPADPQPAKPAKPAAAAAPTPVQGLLLALMSAVALSLFNVCLKLILQGPAPREIFGLFFPGGLFQIEGFVSPGLGNSLLILLLRMIVVMALMPILATVLYPAVWTDIRRFLQSGNTNLMLTVVGSGFFLFLSQVCIYIAIGQIPTGIAITIFFIYPIVTVLASWRLFGDKPTPIKIIAMIVILTGGVLCLPSFFAGAAGNTQLGIIAAVLAGITFAGYVLLTQIAAGKLHPIPFSLVNFAAIFVFCAVSLILLPDEFSLDINPDAWNGILIGGVVLGVLTLLSYLLNNFAIRSAGAALASIIGTSGPALTALFAFLVIGEAITGKQIFGMALVILGVGAMSVERMMAGKKKTAS
ncbi:MAG: EamA family transporter [Microcoleaceae cyanobacterium]